MWKEHFPKKTNDDLPIKYSRKGKKEAEVLFEEDEATNYDQEWDPFQCPISEWTSDKIELYLCSNPERIPTLAKIKESQQNPYGGNPYMLCMFSHENKNTDMWIASSILYHTIQYRSVYDTFCNT